MICSLSLSALAAPIPVDRSGAAGSEPAPPADSQLYYGQVKDILTDEDGTVSGRELDLSGLLKAPYEEDGVLMVPLRLIGEALGYTVGWDPESGAITVDDDDIQKATLFDGSAAVSFEGRLKVIDMTHQWENDAPTACYEGCTYVPLTFFETFFNDVSFQNGLISVSPSMAELN